VEIENLRLDTVFCKVMMTVVHDSSCRRVFSTCRLRRSLHTKVSRSVLKRHFSAAFATDELSKQASRIISSEFKIGFITRRGEEILVIPAIEITGCIWSSWKEAVRLLWWI